MIVSDSSRALERTNRRKIKNKTLSDVPTLKGGGKFVLTASDETLLFVTQVAPISALILAPFSILFTSVPSIGYLLAKVAFLLHILRYFRQRPDFRASIIRRGGLVFF